MLNDIQIYSIEHTCPNCKMETRLTKKGFYNTSGFCGVGGCKVHHITDPNAKRSYSVGLSMDKTYF